MKSCNGSALCAVSFGMAFLLGVATIGQSQTGSDASITDKHFVSEALKGGMAEVQMGHLAAEKGNSGDVKAFGKKMVVDHTRLGDQMKGVAGQIGVTVPASPTMLEEVEIKKLKGLSGDEFDREYIKTMVKAHEGDLNDFKKEADGGKSSVVRDAAGKGADVVSGHLKMIEEIAKAHNLDAK